MLWSRCWSKWHKGHCNDVLARSRWWIARWMPQVARQLPWKPRQVGDFWWPPMGVAKLRFSNQQKYQRLGSLLLVSTPRIHVWYMDLKIYHKKSTKCITSIPYMEHISSIISPPKKMHGPIAPSPKKGIPLASHSETKLKLRTCGLKDFRTSHWFSLTLFGWTLGSFFMMNWVNPTYGDFVYFPEKKIEHKKNNNHGPRLKITTRTLFFEKTCFEWNFILS